MKIITPNNTDTTFLDGMRGLAALYVMIGHARWLLWEGFTMGYSNHPERYNVFEKGLVYLLSVFRYGHEAVLMFFVLSGFVIHLRYAKQNKKLGKNSTFDYIPFLKRRIKRIYPPLILAIIITFILDTIGKYFQLPIYYQNTLYQSINENIIANHEIKTLIGNLLFVIKFYVPEFGTNGPFWSLAYEWWFYMIYPVLFYFNKRSSLLAVISILILYIITNLLSFNIILLDKVLAYLPSWWMGVILADIYTQRIRLKFTHLTPFSLLLCILPFDIIKIPWNGANQWLWSLGFTGLFSLFFTLQKKGILLKPLNVLKPLGDISYSLYVIHMPILVLLSGFILKYTGNQLLPQHFWFIITGLIVSLLAGWCSYQIAEKPFLKKKNK